MQPEAGDIVSTKKVRPNAVDGTSFFDESGPFEEHFEILAYLDPKVDRAYVEEATTRITYANGRVEEKYDHLKRVYALIGHQLKGWRAIAPVGVYLMPDGKTDRTEPLTPPEGCTPEEAASCDGLRGWKFTDYNIARLPQGAALFLFSEIQACDGLIATRAVKVTTDLGQVLDFRGSPQILRPADQREAHDPKRAAVLQPGGAGARNEGTR